MVSVVSAEYLNEAVVRLVIHAPYVAKKAQPGQFVLVRTDELGERAPFTIADYDREKGTITIIVQIVGKTTMRLSELRAGDRLHGVTGPLGNPSHFEGVKTAAVVGGGLGTAIAFPQARMLAEMGAEVDVITGFRTKDLIILKDEIDRFARRQVIMTDDGSNGNKGFVTDALKKLLAENHYDVVVAIGPLIMMKMVCEATRPFGVKTIVSMNSIMVDGTGMCGGCRVTVGGETKFACVDGPDFDGHMVDFDEAMRRGGMYKDAEKQKMEAHICMLAGGLR